MGRAGSLSSILCSGLAGWLHGDAAAVVACDFVIHATASWRAAFVSRPPKQSKSSASPTRPPPPPTLLKAGVIAGGTCATMKMMTSNTARTTVNSTHLRSATRGRTSRNASQGTATATSSTGHQPPPLLSPRILSNQLLASSTGLRFSQNSELGGQALFASHGADGQHWASGRALAKQGEEGDGSPRKSADCASNTPQAPARIAAGGPLRRRGCAAGVAPISITVTAHAASASALLRATGIITSTTIIPTASSPLPMP